MQGWDSLTGRGDGRPCSLHLLICGFLSLSPFLFLFDCAGLFGRLAAAGPRPGLQVTEGVIYATITMGMACFPNLKCLFLTTATKKPNPPPKNQPKKTTKKPQKKPCDFLLLVLQRFRAYIFNFFSKVSVFNQKVNFFMLPSLDSKKRQQTGQPWDSPDSSCKHSPNYHCSCRFPGAFYVRSSSPILTHK